MTGTIDRDAMIVTIGDFVARRFPEVRLGPHDDIFSVGFVNSLFAMELVMFVEKTFDFQVPNDELKLENFRTLDSMASLVLTRRTG